jgi:hypothetical protein
LFGQSTTGTSDTSLGGPPDRGRAQERETGTAARRLLGAGLAVLRFTGEAARAWTAPIPALGHWRLESTTALATRRRDDAAYLLGVVALLHYGERTHNIGWICCVMHPNGVYRMASQIRVMQLQDSRSEKGEIRKKPGGWQG